MNKPLTAVAVLLAAAAAALVAMPATAQKSAADGIAEYRAMLADGNPAELFEAKGEALWKHKRGPRQASLERCDLGLGPGIVKGAWVQDQEVTIDNGKITGYKVILKVTFVLNE